METPLAVKESQVVLGKPGLLDAPVLKTVLRKPPALISVSVKGKVVADVTDNVVLVILPSN